MRCNKIGFGLICLLLLTAQVATGNEIIIEGDGDAFYLTFMGDAPRGISAFGVEVRYVNGTHAIAIESVEPYEVVSGVDATNGTIKIGGYASQYSPTAVHNQVRLAKILSADKIEGVIIVEYLEDFQKAPIHVSNQVDIPPTSIEASVPVYSPPVIYNPPGTALNTPAATGPTDSSKIVTQPSSVPQVTASGVSTTDTPPVQTQTASSSSSDTALPTESSGIDVVELTVSPTTVPLRLYVPVGAIFSAWLLLNRKRRGRIRN